MDRTTKTLMITLCGLITSLATAAILSLIEVRGNLAIYSYMLWFIVPAGAIGAGFVAAIGYYFGARWTNYRPDEILLASMVVVSALTYFALHYFTYSTLRIEGIPLSSVVSYPRFLQFAITNQTYTIGHTSTGGIQLGAWGYGITAIQIIGFSAGGLIVYGMLQGLPFCGDCSRYLVNKGTQNREAKDGEAIGQTTERVAALMTEGKLQEAIREHATQPDEKLGRKATHRTTLLLRRCPVCDKHQLDLKSAVRGRDSWAEIIVGTATTPQTLTL